ncbi:MAG: alkaline phosphatase family protein [Phycisphaerae bacterium]|nr:alkaline phosphatase family protein [Phycisphaerae bacterium]
MLRRSAHPLKRWILQLCSLLALVGPACSKQVEEAADDRDGHGKILLIGIDGLEWNVILPLLREGKMPNLARLMADGVFGELETYAPAKSPVIWTTVATGKPPENHGILDFMISESPGTRRFYNSRDRRCKAIWNILSEFGRRVDVIGWWNTFPVDRDVNGVVVSQANTDEEFRKREILKGGLLRGVPGQVHPESRQDEMLGIFAEVDGRLNEYCDRLFASVGSVRAPLARYHIEQSRWTIRSDEAYRQIALRLMKEPEVPDLFAVYLSTPDVVGHRFWRFYEPGAFKYPPPAELVSAFADVIPNAYIEADRAIGEFIRAFPRNADVIVISDHGMGASNTQLDFMQFSPTDTSESGAHTDGPPGIFVAAGPSFKASTADEKSIRTLQRKDIRRIGRVIDIAPTILALLDVPIGRDMTGRPLQSILSEGRVRELRIYYVDTHESQEWFSSRDQDRAEHAGYDERMRQLRSLGYISDDPTQGTTTVPTTAPGSDKNVAP